MADAMQAGMKLKPLAQRIARAVSQPDCVLLIELATGALLLAWMAHTSVE